jgi:SAM-dependent methyltransferase
MLVKKSSVMSLTERAHRGNSGIVLYSNERGGVMIALEELMTNVCAGDAVLDADCSGSSLCAAALERAGSGGRAIGLTTDARTLAQARAEAGACNPARLHFAKVDVCDLADDLEAIERYVSRNPVSGPESLQDFQAWRESQRDRAPAVDPGSIDVAFALRLQRLLRREHRRRALEQLFWALKPGGRLIMSDVVSDESIPSERQAERAFWNSRVIGVYTESELGRVLREVGFVAPRFSFWEAQPSQVVEGIEFRVVAVSAIKPTGSECTDRGDAVVYRGPYAQIVDDEGHVFVRGERMAVCERTFAFLTRGPLRGDFIAVPAAAPRAAVAWCAPPGTKRSPRETKSLTGSTQCEPGSGCC